MKSSARETLNNFGSSLRKSWTDWSPRQKQYLLERLNYGEMDEVASTWKIFSHAHQTPPALAPDGNPWHIWLMIGGRGAGKTRAGAEWVRAQALGLPPFATAKASRIALVGESEHDVREVMIEGVSGILAVHGWHERPTWLPSRKRLEWSGGQVAQAFSADDPESLRGPQFSCAWSDEMAKWRYAEKAFDMLQFGLRLGSQPRQLITTTPRPTTLLKRLIEDPSSVVTRATTRDNANNLAPTFLRTVMGRYAGTQIGRQELEGEIIEDRPDALWSRALLEDCRVGEAPALQRIVVAVDPPASSGGRAAACGIVAAGIADNGMCYVICDDSVSGLTPNGWAMKAIALWHRLRADALVAEVNQGGEMVRTVINGIDASVPVTSAHATRGKWMRAEPVAALYEQGRGKHAGIFAALEDEMCDFGINGLSSGQSPDRLDALVWAIAALVFQARHGPRIRML